MPNVIEDKEHTEILLEKSEPGEGFTIMVSSFNPLDWYSQADSDDKDATVS